VLWLLRHGDAERDGGTDAERNLTEKGRDQSRWAGEALAALGVELDACLASPKARAAETAKIACEELPGVEVEIAEPLRGGAFDPLELAAGRGEVLLVGHEPDFSTVIAELTGARVKLKKGGLAAVEPPVLHGLYRPKELRRIAD
jgi:phosphohistidine phosphatase